MAEGRHGIGRADFNHALTTYDKVVIFYFKFAIAFLNPNTARALMIKAIP